MLQIVISFILLLSFIHPSFAQLALPRLKVENNQFVNQTNQLVTLRGVSLCSLSWKSAPDAIKEITSKESPWPVNVIRLPVQPREWKRQNPQTYISQYLDPAIMACRRNKIYCIIDWHSVKGWDKEETEKDLLFFWSWVAPRYSTATHVLYEMFNEPTRPTQRTEANWLAWRKKAQTWVNDIRKSAPETPILIGSPHWSQMPAFAMDHPFEGDNLVYTMHLYPSWGQEHWHTLFGKAIGQIPLFITEWGWSSQESSKHLEYAGDFETYGKPLKQYLDQHPQVSWTAWSYDDKCSPAMLSKDKDMGLFVQKWLQSTNKEKNNEK